MRKSTEVYRILDEVVVSVFLVLLLGDAHVRFCVEVGTAFKLIIVEELIDEGRTVKDWNHILFP